MYHYNGNLYDEGGRIVSANVNIIPPDVEPMPEAMAVAIEKAAVEARERARTAAEEYRNQQEREEFARLNEPELFRFGSVMADRAADELGVLSTDDEPPTLTAPPEAIEGIVVNGAKVFIGGMDGDGKSALAHELGVALGCGTPPFGIERFPVLVEPAPTLMIQTEIDDLTFRSRTQRILTERGATEHAFAWLPQAAAMALDFSKGRVSEEGDILLNPSRAKVETFIELAGIRHLVLDPLYALVGDADMSDRDMTIRGTLSWLEKLQTMGVTVVATVMCNPDDGIRGIFGSKYLRMHVEDMLTIRRRDVAGHPLLSDFTVTRIPKRWRDRYPKHTFKLRGHGVGVFEERAAKTEKADKPKGDPPPKDERLDVARESLLSDPELSLRQRSEKTGIPKSSLSRLIEKVREE